VVTENGKPFALMIDLPENENIEDIRLIISGLRAKMAARAIRNQSRRDGLDKMTEAQIDEIIEKTRCERKQK
jgi:hypothetical protein